MMPTPPLADDEEESDTRDADTPAPVSSGHLLKCAVCRGRGKIVVEGPTTRRSARACIVCRGWGWVRSGP